MAEIDSKTKDDLKFRVVDDETTGNNANPSADSTKPTGSLATTPNQMKSNPDDLITIISDPNAKEHEWVPACNELDKQNRKNNFNKKAKEPRKINAWWLVVAAPIVLMAGYASAPYFQTNVLPWTHSLFQKSEQDIDFKPYMAAMEKEIKNHWHPPKGTTSNHIRMHFKVLKNGDVTDVGFDRLSRISDADAAALKAVIESTPALPPLPQGAPDSIDIVFSFDYNVNAGDTGSAPASK